MTHCRDCKHWKTPASLPTIYDYDGSTVPRDYGHCGHIVHLHKKRPSPEPAIARVCDSEEYSAWLETKPEFGCVLGET